MGKCGQSSGSGSVEGVGQWASGTGGDNQVTSRNIRVLVSTSGVLWERYGSLGSAREC